MILSPPKLSDLRAGTKLKAGLGESTILPDIDFETYSPAGFVWDNQTQKFKPPHGANVKGLFAVNAAAYSEHPDAEVLSLAYDLKDGKGKHLWTPHNTTFAFPLLSYVSEGGILEAWNSAFEYWIWNNICVPKYGFPRLHVEQLRCAASKSRAHCLPGNLADCGKVLNTNVQKDKDGKRLLEKFSIPRNATKNDPRTRILPSEDVEDAKRLYAYNLRDIEAEAELSSLIPDLSPSELEFWLCDQKINRRGIQVDAPMISACMTIVEQAHAKYNRELQTITGGEVHAASEIAKMVRWINSQGMHIDSLTAEVIDLLLRGDLGGCELPIQVRRVLEIRELIGSAAVKKLYSMSNQMSQAGRLHDMFIYHSARTGRAAGNGPQPQNLPNSGPDTYHCKCARYFSDSLSRCPWCGVEQAFIPGFGATLNHLEKEWNADAVEDALETIATRSLECVEYHWGDAIAVVSGCLRGLFIPAPGHDLICSDYSAIEAVVLAELAGEEWRMEVFRTHGKIYEMSASTITGIPFEEFEKHKNETGQHHPMRKKIGKISELASGYGGWLGAWKQFGADEYFNDEEIKQAILAWRKASPAIVEFWGGQQRNWRPELFGLEGCAVSAVLNPGTKFSYRTISYLMHGDALYCELPSGRFITYHRPRLGQSERGGYQLSFEGWNTNPKNGAPGWIRINTYGGRLCENVVQAVARDILAHAIVNLEHSGYPIVMHVHDEIVAEVLEGKGSIEEFEKIMSTLPSWASGWGIKATGGWRGKRYGK